MPSWWTCSGRQILDTLQIAEGVVSQQMAVARSLRHGWLVLLEVGDDIKVLIELLLA